MNNTLNRPYSINLNNNIGLVYTNRKFYDDISHEFSEANLYHPNNGFMNNENFSNSNQVQNGNDIFI